MKAYKHTLHMRYFICISLLIHGCHGNKNNKQTKKAKKEFLILVKIIPFYGDVSLSLVCFDNLDNSKCGCPRVCPPWAHRSYATEDWSVRAVTISQETTCHYKGAVSTLAHKKDTMTSCPLSIFSNFTGIMSLVLIKIFPCFYNW